MSTRGLAPASPSVTVRLRNQPGDNLDFPRVPWSIDHHHVRRDMAHAGYWVLLGPTLLYSLLGELRRERRVQLPSGMGWMCANSRPIRKASGSLGGTGRGLDNQPPTSRYRSNTDCHGFEGR